MVPFAYGHGYIRTTEGWRTIMAYDELEIPEHTDPSAPEHTDPLYRSIVTPLE